MAASNPTSLREIALLFLRLGVTAFGGPAAHVAMMADEVVRRRGWLTEERFLDLLGATNLIPGPNSTEMAIHIGFERRRWAGLLVAGVSFILPTALIVGVLASLYVRFGARPSATWLLHGIKPAVLAVVVQALFGLAAKAARTRRLQLLGVASVAAAIAGLHEIAVLVLAGTVGVATRRARPETEQALVVAPLVAVGGVVGATAVSLDRLFFVFLKTGAVLFGSGYVLLAFLRADLVERLGWLTQAELLDAIAIGQVTPGPVFTTATFVGYLIAGPKGAAVATIGIFLPAFFFVAISAPMVPRLRRSPRAGAFLDGVNVASLALMAVVTVQLGRAAIVDPITAGIGIASAVLLVRHRVNSTWLIAGGAAVAGLSRAVGIA